MSSGSDAFARELAARVDGWEAARTVPFDAARELCRAGAVLPSDFGARMELAAALGGTGSLGTAATVLHATGAPLLILQRHGSRAARERFLAPALAGDACGSVAFASDACTLRPHARGGWELYGSLAPVASVAGADFVIVLARVHGGGDAMVVVATESAGVAATRRATAGLHTTALGELHFTRCRVEAEHVWAAGAAAGAIEDVLADERLLLAVAIVAVTERALHGALAFVGGREFGPGQLLGGQQAVRHRLADLMADHELAAAFARAECAARRGGASFPERAAMTLLVSTEAARRVVEGCMQLQGARGFMADHSASRAYRDLLTIGLLADPDALADAAAAELPAPAELPYLVAERVW
ncbi:MAG TPA: acyl-CoA dehydrogenase family protein [Longimicrobium sp.]|nr:acyl-CoA dehydrogenase family protein [Longimicrobium sp.]